MSIESYLGNGDKLSALTELRSMLAKEIYVACINCGIDPETFDASNYIDNINQNPSINFGPQRVLLFELSKKFFLIQSKIEELQ